MRPDFDCRSNPAARKIWLRCAWLTWLILLHINVIALVMNSSPVRSTCELYGFCHPPEYSAHYHERRIFLRRRGNLLDESFGLVIGDSHIEGLPFELIDTHALNAGIGGDTTLRVLQRLSDYEPMKRWRYVVISVGFNDLKFRSISEVKRNYQGILERIGIDIPVYMIAVLPIDPLTVAAHHANKNGPILTLNAFLEAEASKRDNVTFVDLHALMSEDGLSMASHWHIGDGVHLNPDGQRIVIEQLRAVIMVGETESV